jgi:hypothetical protein
MNSAGHEGFGIRLLVGIRLLWVCGADVFVFDECRVEGFGGEGGWLCF